MGRWSQRQRRGGGTSQRPPAEITIVAVTINNLGSGELSVEFSDSVSAGDFDPTAFVDLSLAQAASDVQQGAVNQLRYSDPAWVDNLLVGDIWQYADSVLNVVSPQSGSVS
jgi:hypothetical protein